MAKGLRTRWQGFEDVRQFRTRCQRVAETSARGFADRWQGLRGVPPTPDPRLGQRLAPDVRQPRPRLGKACRGRPQRRSAPLGNACGDVPAPRILDLWHALLRRPPNPDHRDGNACGASARPCRTRPERLVPPSADSVRDLPQGARAPRDGLQRAAPSLIRVRAPWSRARPAFSAPSGTAGPLGWKRRPVSFVQETTSRTMPLGLNARMIWHTPLYGPLPLLFWPSRIVRLQLIRKQKFQAQERHTPVRRCPSTPEVGHARFEVVSAHVRGYETGRAMKIVCGTECGLGRNGPFWIGSSSAR